MYIWKKHFSFILYYPFREMIVHRLITDKTKSGYKNIRESLNKNLDKVKVTVKSLSRVRLYVTPWTVAYQAPLSMGFSRQEYWSGLPFSSPRDLPNPGIKPGFPALEADALTSEPPGKPSAYGCLINIWWWPWLHRRYLSVHRKMIKYSKLV